MKNLKQLFELKPDLGWGEKSEYKSNCSNISEAVNILSGGMTLVFMRTSYNRKNEENPNKLSYRKWLKEVEREDCYVSYLMKEGYELKEGDFILNVNEKKLNEIAGVYLKYVTGRKPSK